MAVMEAGSAAHRAAVDDLERGLGPFADPGWRAELEHLTDWATLESVQWAGGALTIARLAAAVPRTRGDDRGGTPWTSFVREVAVARKLSDSAATREVHLSLALTSRHPETLRRLMGGQAPAHRAQVLVEHCLGALDAVVAEVERTLAPQLADLTPARIRQEVDRIVLRLDADAAARAEASATADRTLRKRPLPHAQAEAVLTGPAVLVQQWWDALTGRARALKAAGDPRSLGALRFDLAVTTDPRTGNGTDPLLAVLGVPGALAADGRPTGPGSALTDDARCSRPVQARIDVPAATALGLSDEPGWLDGHGWISAPLSRQLLTAAELVKACTHPDTGQLVDVAARPVRPGLDPGHLREALRRMVVTPHELRDVVVAPQPQHDPSPALEAFVHARDRYCDGPTGTQVPARRTDEDHEQPWPAGATQAANLVSRAGRTHQLKHAGWTPVRSGRGTTWTSPAGQRAFAPAHRHPPDPPPPGAVPPDPVALAARDRALTRPPCWPEPEVDAPPLADGPLVEDDQRTVNGWPAEPGF